VTQAPVEDTVGMDQAILQVERLYRSITGMEIPVDGSIRLEEDDVVGFVSDEADRLFQMFDAFASDPECPPFVPPMRTIRTADEVVFRVQLTGVPRSAVSVVFTRDTLEVSGDRPMSDSDDIGEPFQRVIPLPPNAMDDEAVATFGNGVLEVRVPVRGDGVSLPPLSKVDRQKLHALYERVYRTIEALDEMRSHHASVTPARYGFGAGIGAAHTPSLFSGVLPSVTGLASLAVPLAMWILRPEGS
jgi:HSP20 family molecular chaperone IbpA